MHASYMHAYFYTFLCVMIHRQYYTELISKYILTCNLLHLTEQITSKLDS